MKPEQVKEIDKMFRDHVATYTTFTDPEGNKIERLQWGKADGSSDCYIDYMIRRSVLFITGDLGTATHRWCDRINFEWLAGLSPHYYMEKCEASSCTQSKHRHGYSWEAEEAFDCMFDLFLSHAAGDRDIREMSNGQKTRLVNGYMRKHFEDVLTKDDEAFQSPRGLYDLINDAGLYERYWEEMGEAGYTISFRHLTHMRGLQLAAAQRAKQTHEAKAEELTTA
jgi:hypothetical protein